MSKNPNRKIITTINKLIKKWEKEYPNKKLIVGIDGNSGTGKSSIATGVAKKNKNLLLVHLDDFLKPAKERKEILQKAKYKPGVYQKNWYDLKDFKNLIKLLNNPGRKRILELKHHTQTPQKIKNKKYNLTKKIALVEGAFLHNTEMYGKIFDKIIFIELPQKVLNQRRIKRFKIRFPQGDQEKAKRISRYFDVAWKSYLKKYNPKKKSDVIIKIKIVNKIN